MHTTTINVSSRALPPFFPPFSSVPRAEKKKRRRRSKKGEKWQKSSAKKGLSGERKT